MIHETRGPGYFMMQDLERQYDQLAGRRGALRLWIASSDPAIDRAMERVGDSFANLVLRVPTEHLMKAPVDGSPVLRVLDFSIERFRLRGIVVCGHASEDVISTRSQVPRPDFAGASGDKLLQGARERMAKNRLWKSRTLNYAAALKNSRLITERRERDLLEVTTVFYLKETGVFSVYKDASKEFEANFGETIFQ
ncbi:hypothetical protein [Blastopirellula retiformator]|uniref:Uncharacterized protein n=1 Tax=Blastopirellula retiformator TaxID=2527970 RepID=A0A5C5UYV9_9BACT|nr:hypothetical protein [Blastopirellula retiformator]TWT30667.1 hypothetical protein Enr8_41880 [Blastopirellula retiformator]